MVPEFPKRIARISAVLTLVGSLIWVQWPIDFSRFNVASMILLIGSFMAWASMELADYSANCGSHDNIMSNDVEKINSVIKLIDSKQFYVLKSKEIQTYMESDDYDGLRRLINFRENDIFPFHNQKIQNLYERFCDDALAFCSSFYSLYTSDGKGSTTWRPSGHEYVSDEIYEEIMGELSLLNRDSSRLAERWEGLINVCLQELKGASKAIERYEM